MQEFIIAKLPESVKHAYIDADPLIYAGAFAVQKAKYQYTNVKTGEKSVMFEDARRGKQWLSQEEEKSLLFCLDEFTSADWEREKVVDLGTEDDARKATDLALKGYLKFVHGCEWRGFITQRDVLKTKDIPGLERRYQGNRDKLVSPVHHKVCRDHLLSKEEIKQVIGGFEADAIVIASAEKKGKEACLLSLDKDLRQAEGTYILDMSYTPPLILFTEKGTVGGVWECPVKSNIQKRSYKYTGVGFKWLCYQTVAGDQADHYGGIKGVGSKTVLEALEGCETYHQCLDAVYALYEAHGRFKYTSWDGQEVDLSPAEMMLQHFNLAYQERSPTDSFTFEKYNWSVEDYEKRKGLVCNV